MSVEQKLPVDTPQIKRSCIERLSHNIVSDWVEETNISLRPADKSALKKMICMQVPGFIEDNLASLMEQFINKVKQNERKACIEAISELDEPISGLINKQLTLNVCAYPHPEREENSATVQPAGELAQN